jgi:hypothetical protein
MVNYGSQYMGSIEVLGLQSCFASLDEVGTDAERSEDARQR